MKRLNHYRPVTNDASNGESQAFAKQNDLLPWDEVAAEVSRRTGEPITRGRCQQIAAEAEDKIADALWSFAADEGWVPR
jgi:hypothetical protein